MMKGYSPKQQPAQPNQRNIMQPEPVVLQKEKAYDFADLLTVCGVLEVVDNYGFLRSADYNYLR